MQTVVVFGGSGFIGSRLVAKLVDDGYHVIIPTRRRERVKRDLIVLPNTDVVACSPFEPRSLTSLVGRADIVVNLVSILHETSRQSFEEVNVEYVRRLTDAVSNVGNVRQMIHVSALNASPGAPSRYLRSKGKGEAFISKLGRTHWTTVRPSVVFGNGDSFLHLFARFMRLLPVIALPAPDARFQPIWVDDLAQVIAASVRNPDCYDKVLSAGGPHVMHLLETVHRLRSELHIGCKVLPFKGAAATLLALGMEMVPFMPPVLTRDNLLSMSVPSVCENSSNDAPSLVSGSLTSVHSYLSGLGRKQSPFSTYNSFRHLARRG